MGMTQEEERLYRDAVKIAAWSEEYAAKARQRAEQAPDRYREGLMKIKVEVAEDRARAQRDFITLLFCVREEKLCADIAAELAEAGRNRAA